MGPSPRVRGKAGAELFPGAPGGTIPACAGQSRQSRSRREIPRDHPRVCGAKSVCRCSLLCRRWTIPACAGQSAVVDVGSSATGDHPRVCGAKRLYTSTFRSGWGPSPRVRGKADKDCDEHAIAGTIPTCAGQRLPELLFYNPRRWF